MKILWFTNIPLPSYSLLVEEEPVPFGGWLVKLSDYLGKCEGVELGVAFPYGIGKKNPKISKDKITHYPFPLTHNNRIIKKIIADFKPDIVHIFGTEMSHSSIVVDICNEMALKVVISIQGLVSKISKHILADLPSTTIYGSTIRNVVKSDNIRGLQKKFYKRGIKEEESIKKVNHIIGRTSWDRACVTQINPDINYYYCNEILRDEFYKKVWNINQCERYSIFISQAQYPLKGLHYLLEAMPIILRKFPSAKIYVGGHDVTKTSNLKEKLLITNYGIYIKKLMKKNKLEEKVVFTGPLDEKKMCDRYLKSHLFVCPSTIENSPNSLGEAMLLGVPSVASYVGGIPDMLKHLDEGYLYQANAPYMLAEYICKVFEDDQIALKFSRNARIHALKTHNIEKNNARLLEIYDAIKK